MAENVAQLVINRGRSGTKSLRKGDLLQKDLKRLTQECIAGVGWEWHHWPNQGGINSHHIKNTDRLKSVIPGALKVTIIL